MEVTRLLELIKQLTFYGVQLDIQPRPEGVSFIFGKGEFSRDALWLDLNYVEDGKADLIEPILLVTLEEFVREYSERART